MHVFLVFFLFKIWFNKNKTVQTFHVWNRKTTTTQENFLLQKTVDKNLELNFVGFYKYFAQQMCHKLI